MHEFVATAAPLKKKNGVSAMDLAKRLLDFGFHAPTVYFPLTVPEAMMISMTAPVISPVSTSASQISRGVTSR